VAARPGRDQRRIIKGWAHRAYSSRAEPSIAPSFGDFLVRLLATRAAICVTTAEPPSAPNTTGNVLAPTSIAIPAIGVATDAIPASAARTSLDRERLDEISAGSFLFIYMHPGEYGQKEYKNSD
jgi:hypothetical protein